MPSKNESGTGVWSSPNLFLKKTFAPVASAMFPSWSSIRESIKPCASASCLDKVHIMYNPAALVSHGIVFGAGLLQLEIFNFIPFNFNLGSKYDPHSQVATATWILFFCAEIAIISLPRQIKGLTYPFWTFCILIIFLHASLISCWEYGTVIPIRLAE